MISCPNCHNQFEDDTVYCPVCGTAVHTFTATTQSVYEEGSAEYSSVPFVDPFDHTEKFSSSDIEETKLVCMLVYLLDFIGIIIGLLAAKESEYTAFHIRQSMKFTILELLIGLAAMVLAWTFIVPIAAAIAMLVLLILKFISFLQVCEGKAKEPALLRAVSFLK